MFNPALVVLHYSFEETVIQGSWWIESSKEQYLFEIYIFYNNADLKTHYKTRTFE